MSDPPESLILQVRAELGEVRAQSATKSDLQGLRAELKSDMHSLRADVASDLLSMRKELSDQVVGLRRAVIDYHNSVIGHGVLIGDLEARTRRIEQHLNLPPLGAS